MESMPGRIQAAVPFIKIGNVIFVLGPGTATAVTASANGFWQFWNDKLLPFSWIQIILLCFSFFQLGTAMSWSALMSSQPLPTISNQYHGPISSAWNLQSFGVSSMKQLDFKDLEDLTRIATRFANHASWSFAPPHHRPPQTAPAPARVSQLTKRRFGTLPSDV